MNYSSSTLVAKSGEIYDTNMTPIAVSSRVYILIIDPKVIMETEAIEGRKGTLETTVKAIAQCFDLDEAALTDTITQSADKNYIRYVPEGWTSKKYLVTESQKEAFDALEEKVNSTEKKKETKTTEAQSVQETEGTSSADEEFESPEGAKIVGVWFETEYQRYYPYGNLASKVIGFTTKDSSEGICRVCHCRRPGPYRGGREACPGLLGGSRPSGAGGRRRPSGVPPERGKGSGGRGAFAGERFQ